MAERKSTLEECVARARARLDERRGPGPFDCPFCGVNTEHPCVLANALECQNFGHYPKPKPAPAHGVPASCARCGADEPSTGTCSGDGPLCAPGVNALGEGRDV